MKDALVDMVAALVLVVITAWFTVVIHDLTGRVAALEAWARAGPPTTGCGNVLPNTDPCIRVPLGLHTPRELAP